MKSVLSIILFLVSLPALAHEGHTLDTKSTLAISVAFDQLGQLWRVSVKDGIIYVDKSNDKGKTFSSAVQVNDVAQKVAAKGEARPKIAVGSQGDIYLTWTEGLAKPFTGYIWFSRSTNNGKSFEKPKIVHQDRAEITHRFDALTLSPNGEITVVWVDKRDLEKAKNAGKTYTGAAIYYAVSTDNGESFQPERKLADSSCECCRIATSTKPDGTVVAMWRHVFKGSERDHAIAEIPKGDAPTNLKRATFGHWKIDGCPHHGAALARGGEGDDWWGYHMAYFDGKDKGPGLYYSRMDGEAWVTSPPKKIGENEKQARHPAILSMGDKVWLAWLETNGNNDQEVMGAYSKDGGKTWMDATSLLTIKGKTDYPQLLQFKDTAYLVVNTSKGLTVAPVKP